MNMKKLMELMSKYWALNEDLGEELEKLGGRDIEMGNCNRGEIINLCMERVVEDMFNALYEIYADDDDKKLNYYKLCKKYNVKY